MAGAGVDGLRLIAPDGKKYEMIRIKSGLLPTGCSAVWHGNSRLERANFYKRLKVGYTTIHNLILALDSENKISLKKLDLFRANGNFVTPKELYPEEGEHICCFYKNGIYLRLITVGSKDPSEVLATGYDSYNHSTVPFLIKVAKDNEGRRIFVPINLL